MNVVAPPQITPADRLSLTLFLATALHGIIVLGIAFNPEDKADLRPPPSLEIILVQNRSTAKPENPDYLAQISQIGGGISELRERPSNPFTSSEQVDDQGIAPFLMEASIPESQQPEPEPLITQLHAEDKVQQTQKQQETEKPTNKQNELSEYDLQIAKLTTELDLALEAYAKRPKKLVLTANTHEYIPARYMHDWIKKVERLGNLNLPEEAKHKTLEGSLLLEVEIKWDGSLVETNLIKSSGYPVLDNAAINIVHLSSPFKAFPVELRQQADHLEIVRTWNFQKGGLVTQ